jgi:plasmid stabilization system protein ParE
MARLPIKLKLDYTAEALEDLATIWKSNAEQRSDSHADRYVAYLKTETRKLTGSLNLSRSVPTNPSRRYALIRRRSTGFGHLVVFRIFEDSLRKYHYYHTSQDWQNLEADKSE